MADGALNYKGIEILREVETAKKKYFRGSILPCSATLKRCAKSVEMMGQVLFPYTIGHLANGVEFLQFDYDKTVSTLLERYGLNEKANVSIAQSIDGANLTKHLRHVTAGIKINDLRAKDPITGNFLLSNGNNAQSRNICFPLKVLLCPENKKTYYEFTDMFEYFSNSNLCVSTEADMSAVWKD